MPVELSPRALCTIDQVKLLVPGYDGAYEEQTEDALLELINAISDDVLARGREFVKLDTTDDPVARLFDLDTRNTARRRVRIGDCATISTVKVVELDGTVLETVAAGSYIPLPRTRASSDPIRELWFPASGVAVPATLRPGLTVQVTAVWGFPEIPPRVANAVAKLVLVRYVADVAEEGTGLAAALEDVAFGGMLASARETLDRFHPGFA